MWDQWTRTQRSLLAKYCKYPNVIELKTEEEEEEEDAEKKKIRSNRIERAIERERENWRIRKSIYHLPMSIYQQQSSIPYSDRQLIIPIPSIFNFDWTPDNTIKLDCKLPQIAQMKYDSIDHHGMDQTEETKKNTIFKLNYMWISMTSPHAWMTNDSNLEFINEKK